jgi:hypothetical protein
MQDKLKTSGSRSPQSQEELPYVIELADGDAGQRVLARASSPQLAQEIFKAAKIEHPERQIILRKGGRVVADSTN